MMGAVRHEYLKTGSDIEREYTSSDRSAQGVGVYMRWSRIHEAQEAYVTHSSHQEIMKPWLVRKKRKK